MGNILSPWESYPYNDKQALRKGIEELIPDIVRYEDAIKEMTKRISEHSKYEYEKPEGSLPHMCAECWEWKRRRRAYRTDRNALSDRKKRYEEGLSKLEEKEEEEEQELLQ